MAGPIDRTPVPLGARTWRIVVDAHGLGPGCFAVFGERQLNADWEAPARTSSWNASVIDSLAALAVSRAERDVDRFDGRVRSAGDGRDERYRRHELRPKPFAAGEILELSAGGDFQRHR